MKKLVPLILCMAFALTSFAQSVSFTVTTAPCFNDGVLTANFTGFTPPLNVQWTTVGTTGTTITHSGVSGMSDAITSYSGGPVYIYVVEACCSTVVAYDYFPGAPPFTYTVSTTPFACPTPGSATATVTGGTAPFTYSWFDAATSSVVSTTNPATLPAGAYGVTIDDAAGCEYGSLVNDDTVNIWSIPSFAVGASSTTASCTNGTATVTSVGAAVLPVTYLWSNGATTPSIAGLTMGSYTVDVTDAAGCVAMGYTYVPQSITISAPVTPTPATCIATNGAVIAFGSGGMPPYSYLWSNGATTQSQTGLGSGYYDVVVTDANGCIGTGNGYVGATTPIYATYATTPSLCTAPTGSATLTLTGGTGGYTINWFTTPPQTGLTATALPAGSFGFHVVDGVGCVQSGTVTVPPVNIISTTFTSTSALCTTASGSLNAFPSGGTTPYTYLWSTGATTSGISSVPAGSYGVTITDAAGCIVRPYSNVPVFSPMSVGLTTTPASCIFTSDGAISATALGGTLPYTYSWSGSSSTGSTATSLAYGPYWLNVTDAMGCSAWLYNYVPYNPSGTSCYCTITGTVYDDANGNCVQDAGEAGIPHIQIGCSGRGYTYTDMSGHYSFQVPSGTYTISETVRTFYPLSACQLNNISVTAVAATGCVQTVDFGNTISVIHDMRISTWNYNHPIPGHIYNQISVITNEGTVAESSVLAGYEPDGQIFAPTFVPGGIFLGAPYWYNTAAAFPTLSPGATSPYLTNYFVPTSIPLGTNLVFKDSVANTAPITNWLSDYTPWNNVRYLNTSVISSYDPNFKEVIPAGTGPTGIITANDTVLEYMVHFQNTGTAPADNILVIDTLDNDLDWTSLHPVYMSAQGKVTLEQSGSYKIAKFSFPNINLPPQSVNEITSNGMFTYTIKTLPGLPVGTQFKNSASIYFDYNAPVLTNTTVNTLGGPGIGAVNGVPADNHSLFNIYPNPAAKSFSIAINNEAAGTAEMNIADVAGKVLINKTIALQKGTQDILIDVNQLTPGVYFVSLIENGKSETRKLVIMK